MRCPFLLSGGEADDRWDRRLDRMQRGDEQDPPRAVLERGSGTWGDESIAACQSSSRSRRNPSHRCKKAGLPLGFITFPRLAPYRLTITGSISAHVLPPSTVRTKAVFAPSPTMAQPVCRLVKLNWADCQVTSFRVVHVMPPSTVCCN